MKAFEAASRGACATVLCGLEGFDALHTGGKIKEAGIEVRDAPVEFGVGELDGSAHFLEVGAGFYDEAVQLGFHVVHARAQAVHPCAQTIYFFDENALNLYDGANL